MAAPLRGASACTPSSLCPAGSLPVTPLVSGPGAQPRPLSSRGAAPQCGMADPTCHALSAIYSGPPLPFRTRATGGQEPPVLQPRVLEAPSGAPGTPSSCPLCPQAPQGAAHFPGHPLGDLRNHLPGHQPLSTVNTLLGVGLGFAFKPKDCLFSF